MTVRWSRVAAIFIVAIALAAGVSQAYIVPQAGVMGLLVIAFGYLVAWWLWHLGEERIND